MLPPAAPRRQCPLQSWHRVDTALGRFDDVDALERARQVASSWDERLRADLPPDLEIFDAHTHLGTDIDGMVGRYEELIGSMDGYGISRAFVFCLDEPDRHPGFRAGNDRTLEFAGGSDAELRAWLRRLLLNNLGAFARRYRWTQKRALGCEVPLGPRDSSAGPGHERRAAAG